MTNTSPVEGITLDFTTAHALRFSDEVAEVFSAYIALQGEIENVSTDASAKVKTKSGGDYSYSYATLASLLSSLRPAMHKHGLGVLQGTQTGTRGEVTVDTRIIHGSGQWIENSVTLYVASNADAQQIGSGISYARRYGLMALVAIAASDDDDDGQRAAAARPDSGPSRRQQPPAARANQFADPNRPANLVAEAVYKEILEISHGLSDAERRTLTAWRESEGIEIKPSTLTAAQAQQVLDQIARIIGLDDADTPPGELYDADPDPLGDAAPSLEDLPAEYGG